MFLLSHTSCLHVIPLFSAKWFSYQAKAIRDVLGCHETASSQLINIHKTNLVFPLRILQNWEGNILVTIDIREALAHEKCLGLPTKVDRLKKKPFLPIKECSRKKLHDWVASISLGWVGKC